MNETQVTVVGNIGGGDPELRFLGNGTAVCKFRVACTPRKFKDNKWEDGETSWYQVTAWRFLGENVAESLRNGDRVVVHGNLSIRVYEKDGERRTSTEVEALEVGAGLSFATVAVTKVKRTESAGGGRSTARSASAADDPWASTEANAPAGQAAASPAASW